MIPVIPVPKKYEIYTDTPVSLPIVAEAASEWAGELSVLKELFLQIHCVPLEDGTGGIALCADPSLAPRSYMLDVQDTIRLFASDREGMLYGMATLLQLVKVSDDRLSTISVRVEDFPDKDFRAFMLNVIFTVNQLLPF
jgi:N-acetyl-beta-hexosaminidase